MLSALRSFADTAQVKCDKLGIGTVGDDGSCETNLPRISANDSSVLIMLQLTFGALAAIAVLVIVIAAIRFALSEGDPQKVSKARQTIVFAVAGLVVALLAEAIVTFVLGGL